ncbi:MAG: hypothetical protein AAGJ35_15625, partial [Myxococcota bacterium]
YKNLQPTKNSTSNSTSLNFIARTTTHVITASVYHEAENMSCVQSTQPHALAPKPFPSTQTRTHFSHNAHT